MLRELGVWDEVQEHGYGFDALGLTTPDGTVLLHGVPGDVPGLLDATMPVLKELP